MANQATETEPPAEKKLTFVDLANAVQELSQADIGVLPQPAYFAWLLGPDGKQAVLNMNGEFPGQPGMTIFAIFQGEHDIRVYAVATATGAKAPFRRFTITKTAMSFFVENMTLETFVQEVAEEWDVVGEIETVTGEEEREAILEYIGTLKPDYVLSELRSDIENGVHMEGLDDEPEGDDEPEADEEQEVPNGHTVPAPSVSEKPAPVPSSSPTS